MIPVGGAMKAFVVTVGMLLLVATSLRAHHSYAGFFDPKERTVSIEGTLEDILYANPHVVMKIRSADSTVYTVTWQSATWVKRQAGVVKNTFKVGDRLTIVGAPSRDSESHEVTQVRELRRAGDAWTWRHTTPFAPPRQG
jgi:Family of unknown function (DUF6152)